MTITPPRDLSRPPQFQILCANPFCHSVVLYLGEFCKACTDAQASERARLQAQKDPR